MNRKISGPRFQLYEDANEKSELIALMFTVAEVPYKEIPCQMPPSKELLQKMPLMVLPVLEIDGIGVSGQLAICRQLAWRFGFGGANALQDSIVDMLTEFFNEASVRLNFFEKYRCRENASVVKNQRDYLIAEFLPKLAHYLNGVKNDYLVGDKLTWADIMAFTFIKQYLLNIIGDDCENIQFSKINDYYKKLMTYFQQHNYV